MPALEHTFWAQARAARAARAAPEEGLNVCRRGGSEVAATHAEQQAAHPAGHPARTLALVVLALAALAEGWGTCKG